MASRVSWLPVGLFVVWLGVSQQWYVCRIKQACETPEPLAASAVERVPESTESEVVEAGPAVVPAPAPSAPDPVSVVADSTAEIVDNRVEILFQHGSEAAQTDAAVEGFLDQLAARIQKTREAVTLVGHTDSKGAPAFNLKLGLARAEHVRDQLISRGVDPSRVRVLSEGGASPVASNETKEGRHRNRRVEFVFRDGV